MTWNLKKPWTLWGDHRRGVKEEEAASDRVSSRAQKYLCSGSHSDKGARSSSLCRRGFPRLLKQQLLFTFPSNVNHRRRHIPSPHPPTTTLLLPGPAAPRQSGGQTSNHHTHKTFWHVLHIHNTERWLNAKMCTTKLTTTMVNSMELECTHFISFPPPREGLMNIE